MPGHTLNQAGVYNRPLSTHAVRTCLRCSETFDSKGPHNRICPDCSRVKPLVSRMETEALPSAPNRGKNPPA